MRYQLYMAVDEPLCLIYDSWMDKCSGWWSIDGLVDDRCLNWQCKYGFNKSFIYSIAGYIGDAEHVEDLKYLIPERFI